MFESSLIALQEKKRPRRWTALPVAIALHVAALASIALAQAWQVAAVAEPPVVSPYHVVLLPPPPPPAPAGGGQRPQTAPVPTPEPRTPRQPDTREIPELAETPEPVPGPAATDGPVVEGVSDFGVPGGQEGGVPGGVPNSQGGGGIGLDGLVTAPPPPRDEILRVTGAVKRPLPLSARPPRYTEPARRAGVEGAVILEAIIDEQGRVVNARILKGLPLGLDQEALATVREWRFQPATLGDRPVKVFYTLTVHFQIQR